MPKNKVLVIDRARWRCGGHAWKKIDAMGPTQLLNEKGFMCCLGFDALARGVPKHCIIGIDYPTEVDIARKDYWHILDRYHKDVVSKGVVLLDKAVGANDNESYSPSVREAKVRSALMELGWKDVKFIGEYPKRK